MPLMWLAYTVHIDVYNYFKTADHQLQTKTTTNCEIITSLY